MVCTVTLVSAGRTAPEPMERVVSLVPAGRTPWRLCGWRGCYDARDSRHLPLVAERLWSEATRDPQRTVRRRFPACFLRFPPQPRGGKHLFSALFHHARSFPPLSPVWLETTGAKPLPGSAFLAMGLGDSVLGFLSLWDPKATGT